MMGNRLNSARRHRHPLQSLQLGNQAGSSSQQTAPPPPPPPVSYQPTTHSYDYVNFGLPLYDGTTQQYRLNHGIQWRPTTPATLILAMNNMNVIKVGLLPSDVTSLNSIMFEMRRALPTHLRQTLDMEYITHNTLIFMQVDDQTNIQILRGDYIIMQPASILARWPTRELEVVTLCVRIVGLQRCCGLLTAKLHVDSMMIVDEDFDEGFEDFEDNSENIVTIL